MLCILLLGQYAVRPTRRFREGPKFIASHPLVDTHQPGQRSKVAQTGPTSHASKYVATPHSKSKIRIPSSNNGHELHLYGFEPLHPPSGAERRPEYDSRFPSLRSLNPGGSKRSSLPAKRQPRVPADEYKYKKLPPLPKTEERMQQPMNVGSQVNAGRLQGEFDEALLDLPWQEYPGGSQWPSAPKKPSKVKEAFMSLFG